MRLLNNISLVSALIWRTLHRAQQTNTQPVDRIFIQNITEEWERRWDQYKLECISGGKKKEGTCKGIGKILNPEKYLFLKLDADAVREVN